MYNFVIVCVICAIITFLSSYNMQGSKLRVVR